jgi:hypothetical protein
MHVIWCIRALRHLTALRFTSLTNHEFGHSKAERDRKHFLTLNNPPEVTFFATRMSTDSEYIAPRDAQERIIEKWREWYKANGKDFEYRPSQSIDDWYF